MSVAGEGGALCWTAKGEADQEDEITERARRSGRGRGEAGGGRGGAKTTGRRKEAMAGQRAAHDAFGRREKARHGTNGPKAALALRCVTPSIILCARAPVPLISQKPTKLWPSPRPFPLC